MWKGRYKTNNYKIKTVGLSFEFLNQLTCLF